MSPKAVRNPHLITLSFIDEEYDQLEQVLFDLAQKALVMKRMPMRRATFLRALILEAMNNEEIITKILVDRGEGQN